MKLTDVIVLKEENQRLDEALPAVLVWAAGVIATAIGTEVLLAGIEKWMIYMDKVNFNPSPDAIPDGMRIKGKDGKWITWNADSGKWRIPAGSPAPSLAEITEIWKDALSQGKVSRMFNRKLNFDNVTEDSMARAIYRAKLNDVEGARASRKSLDDLHERWVKKGKSATFVGRIQNNAQRFFRMAGLTGTLLAGTAWAYYYITAREIKEAIDADYASGAITSRQEYEQAIQSARAAFTPVAMASIMALGASNIVFLLVQWIVSKVAGRGGAAGRLAKNLSRLSTLGVGVISATFVASERGRASIAELMTNVVFADTVDEVQEVVWNWFGGNYQRIWAEKDLADPSVQTGIDSSRQEDPNVNPEVSKPTPPESGKSNLEKFF